MMKTKIIKVKSIENEEVILATTMTKIIIATVIMKKTIIMMTVCSCHVTYAFESESTFYSCLNVKELLARSRRKI